MPISLYDASVATYLQTLGAVSGFLEKGAAHCEAQGIELAEIVETRLHPDMRPFRFQIVSVAHHSLGALRGAEAGIFAPPPSQPDLDYAALQKLVSEAHDTLAAVSREDVEALEGRNVVFKLGDFKLPFTAEGFFLSFSIPNFFFHATTAYDILRMKGVPIGKRDFMGRLRVES